MSDDALRTAAEIMRAEWAGTTQEDFYAAVADWLDSSADFVERNDGLALHALEPGALAVARAYLGTDK